MGKILMVLVFMFSCARPEFSQIKSTTKEGVVAWPNAYIPYYIETSGFSETQIRKIEKAANYISSRTVLNIVRVESLYDYVLNIQHKSYGCSASLGYKVSARLRLGSECSYGSTIHEFLHVAGLAHEQLHPDGPIVFLEKVRSGKEHNFKASNPKAIGAYDPYSIMHYSSYSFSLCSSLEDPKWKQLDSSKLPDIRCRRRDWKDLSLKNYPVDCRTECSTVLTTRGRLIQKK